MKKESGMGIIAIIITIALIIILGVLGYRALKSKVKDEKIKDIKANMLIIQGKCKVLGETSSKVNNNAEELKGNKLSDMKEDKIISEFLEKGLIEEDKLDKYYALSDDDLKDMELDIKNENKSYYIINYETNEVYITKGYKNVETEELKYKLEE